MTSSTSIVDRLGPERTTLVVARGAIGLAAWFAPTLTAKIFGIGTTDRFVTRLFGARELVLAAGLLATPEAHVREVAAIGAVVDAVDAVAGFDERRRGNLGLRATILGPVGAIGFAALGGLVAVRASRSKG